MLDDLAVAEGEVVPVPHLRAADDGVCAVVEEEDGVDDEY